MPQLQLTVNGFSGIMALVIFSPPQLDSPPEAGSSQIVNASSLTVSLPRPPRNFYRHGWQSWSLAAWTEPTPLPVQRPAILHPLQTDPHYVNEASPHSSWVGAVELAEGDILLLGSLRLDAHVWLKEDQLEGRHEANRCDWFLARGSEEFVFAQYAEELGKRFGKKSDKPNPRVWCSWYSLYTAIDESILHQIFDDLDDLPFDVLQVDDGWQTSIGDWDANKKFPSGMNALAERIKSTGRRAGLWLAPLIAVESSRLFREHPDWFLHDASGRFVSAGFNWGEQLYALDTSHPAVLEWLSALMKQVRAWGFDYLKLDFLYAGALPGKRFTDMPREVAYRQALKTMREAMGHDAYFLTCGAPILPSLGLCDALRVGPDISDTWENLRDATLLYNFTTPGERNEIRTTVNRLWLQTLVAIDPDVVYFTEKENLLSEEHKQLIRDLALICNFKATSDLPQWLSPAERESLRKFLNATPQVIRLNLATFQIDDRVVDFSSALTLPPPPRGLTKLPAAFLGWLGNQPFALNLFHRLNESAFRKKRGRAEIKSSK
ncbi:MAG: alpha-galactosidase [Anaerolineales bacterium]|nr:alpha-galactosidase [Anaerolineales bacterium]